MALAREVLDQLLARGGRRSLVAREGKAFALQILLQGPGASAFAEGQAQQRPFFVRREGDGSHRGADLVYVGFHLLRSYLACVSVSTFVKHVRTAESFDERVFRTLLVEHALFTNYLERLSKKSLLAPYEGL